MHGDIAAILINILSLPRLPIFSPRVVSLLCAEVIIFCHCTSFFDQKSLSVASGAPSWRQLLGLAVTASLPRAESGRNKQSWGVGGEYERSSDFQLLDIYATVAGNSY